MAIDFPNSPSNGDIHTVSGKRWQWDGEKWQAYGASLAPDVLYVDQGNARVGINDTTPSYSLDVTGTAHVTGAITASGGVVGNVTGNASGTALTVTQPAQTAITSLGTLTGLTVSGDIDVDGTTNLDNVDIDGTVQIDSTLTVGVDGDSSDVKFFGTTASTGYLLWDKSQNDLIIGPAGSVGIGETAPASDLVVRADSAAGRGGEITILNYATSTVGNEAALNFGLENSTYAGDVGNAQIKARLNATSGAADLIFSNYTGGAFTEHLRIMADGKVGIGTASPAHPLDVVGSSHTYIGILAGTDSSAGLRLRNDARDWDVNIRTDDKFSVYDQTASAARLTIDTSGNVGIGTTSPVSALEIASDEDLTDFTSTTRGALTISNTDYNSGDYQSIDFRYNTSSGPNARVAAKHTGSGSYLSFGTSNNYASGVTNEAMVIDYLGKVGIGTTGPVTPLHIAVANGTEALRISGAGGSGSVTGAAYLGFHHWSTGTHPSARIGVIETDVADYDASMVFQTRSSDNDSVPVTRMTISEAGYVGIGRAPSYSLDVETPNAATYVRFKITESYSSYSPMALILQGGANATASIWMGDSADPNIGSITYYNTDNSLRFIANTIQGLKVTNAGVMVCGPGTDITPDSGGAGNVQIRGNGYVGFIAMNTSGLYLGHNSPSRNTYLMTNETVALELAGSNQIMKSLATYNSTTAAAADVHVSSLGQFLRESSSIRYKSDVEDMADEYADKVLNLRPVWYRSTANADRSDWSHWGLVSEEVAAIDPRLVTYGYTHETDPDTGAIVYDTEPVLDNDGNPTYKQIEGVDENGDPTFTDGDPVTRKTGPRIASLDSDGNPVEVPQGVQYAKIVPLLINLIKRQDARIAAQDARLEALESA